MGVITYVKIKKAEDIRMASKMLSPYCSELDIRKLEKDIAFHHYNFNDIGNAREIAVAQIPLHDKLEITYINELKTFAQRNMLGLTEFKLWNFNISSIEISTQNVSFDSKANNIYCNCNNRLPKISYTLNSSFSFCQNCKKEII